VSDHPIHAGLASPLKKKHAPITDSSPLAANLRQMHLAEEGLLNSPEFEQPFKRQLTSESFVVRTSSVKHLLV